MRTLILVILLGTNTITFSAEIQSLQKEVHVLHIGDSLSLGGLGTEALLRLEGEDSITNRSYFSSCGSSPISWTTGSSSYTTRCGYWERTSFGEIKKTQWNNGRPPPSHPTPKLASLISKHRPTHISIQLGTNLFGVLDPNRDSTHQNIRSQVTRLLDEAFSAGSTLTHCLWIAPPDTTSYSSAREQLMFELIQEAASPRCTVIDSREHTNYTRDNRGSGDGIHYTFEGGRKWFASIWPEFLDFVTTFE